MKRFTAFLLSLLLTFSLTACGGNESQNGQGRKKMKVWPSVLPALPAPRILFEFPTYEYLKTGDVIGKCLSFKKN